MVRKFARAGLLPVICGKWPSEYVPELQPAGGIKPEDLDPFHVLILLDEVTRCGSGMRNI